MEWIDVMPFEDPPGTARIPGSETTRWSYCDRHNIWHYTDTCPACQTPWPDSPTGIPCMDCTHCRCTATEGHPCLHTCEPVICHVGRDCERLP